MRSWSRRRETVRFVDIFLLGDFVWDLVFLGICDDVSVMA